MFCPSRPATATSLPAPEMMRDVYYVDAAFSALAHKTPLRLRDYTSCILQLPPLFPKGYTQINMETVPLFQKPNLPIACVPAFASSHTSNTKISSKALHYTKKMSPMCYVCTPPSSLNYKFFHQPLFFSPLHPQLSSSFSKKTMSTSRWRRRLLPKKSQD